MSRLVVRSLRPLSLLAAGLAMAAAGCPGRDTQRFLSIGTGGTAGIYYPLGGALAARLSLADSGRRYTAEVTSGSVENVNRIARGEMDLGFVMGPVVYEAFRGGGDFPVALRNLRIVAPLYPNLTHVLVSPRSSVQSPRELRGRRVSLGAPGSGTEPLAREVLAAHGLAPEGVVPRYLSFRESVDALADGAIDAAIFSVGYPASAVLESMTTMGARLLPIDSAARELLVRRYPYYFRAEIPAGAYPGLARSVPTVAVMNWLVGTATLDSSVVDLVLAVLERDRDELARVSSVIRGWNVLALERAPIPLHPGAAAFVGRAAGR